jgi:hypothetical protein
MLGGVVGFSMPEHNVIAGIYKRCCDVIESHDPSSDRGLSLPSPTELGNEIKELKQLIPVIKQRRN